MHLGLRMERAKASSSAGQRPKSDHKELKCGAVGVTKSERQKGPTVARLLVPVRPLFISRSGSPC